MSLMQRIKGTSVEAKATFYFLICSFLQRGIAFITTPIFTRLLTSEEYGQYNVFMSWFNIATIIIQLNLYGGVFTSGLIKYKEDRDEFSSAFQGLSFVLTALWTIVYFLFSDWINCLLKLSTIQIVFMVLLTWTSCVFGFWSARQRVEYKYKALVIITIISTILKPLLSILLIKSMVDHVTGRILGTVIVESLLYGWMFFSNVRSFRFFCSLKFWKYGLAFNTVLIPHYLSKTVLNTSDRIMISRMVDDSSSGIYSLAHSAGTVMTLFCIAIMNAISPSIYKRIKDDNVSSIVKISNFYLFAVALLNLILVGFAPEFISILGPESYKDAVWVIPPIAYSTFFLFSYEFYSTFEFYYEKTKFITLASIISAILNVFLNYIFIGFFGYIAAGYTTLFCYIAYSIGHYTVANVLSKKNHNGIIAFDGKKIALISAVMILGGTFLMLFYSYPIIRYSIICMIIILLFIYRKPIMRYAKELF